MIEFFRKLFAPESSGATARERLRLVLLSDHLSLAPDVVESLRAELIAVISKYVEVDEANCDVSFEQQDRAVAVLANIPIVSMRSRPGPPNVSVPASPAAAEPPPVAGSATVSAVLEEAVPAAAPSPSRSARRRKRRNRAASQPAPAVT